MRVGLLAVSVSILGCGPGLEDNFGVEETRGTAACENLETVFCMLPYPSDRYMKTGDDPQLAFEPEALPMGESGQPFDVSVFADKDGFGSTSPVLFHLPGAAMPGPEGVYDPEPSLSSDARTVMIDAETGERIPHWIESDYLVQDAPEPITLRPAVPLPRSSRIVVGLRGFEDDQGDVVPAPEPFAALRDQEPSEHIGLHERRAHFEDAIFPVLEAEGFEREELQLAWDFTIGSTEAATGDLLTMRDRMLDIVGDDGPAYTWQNVEVPDDDNIAVIADGVAEVPSFLLPPDDVGVRWLRRDADGLPVADGIEEVPFRVKVPHSVIEGAAPAPTMQFGHGFMGSHNQVNRSYMRAQANDYAFNLIATNMQGMDETVMPTWMGALADNGANLVGLADEAMQGVTNHLALQRLAKGALVDDPHELLERDDEGGAFDPETLWYYGNSQGGSLGTVIMALSVDVERAMLGVPGCCYPFLIHRSYLFEPYAAFLGSMYGGHGDLSLILALVGTGWDRFDPLTYAVHVTDDPLPGTPPHQALLHVAREDGQVINEVSHISGRAMGAKLLGPAVRPIFGFEEIQGPYDGAAVITEYDFGIEHPDFDPRVPPPEEPDSHGWLRKQPEAIEQMMIFFEDGVFVHTCDGPCVFDGPP